MADLYNILEDAVRDMFVRAVWSHKIQEKQAEIYQNQYKFMETANIICTSVTSAGILSSIVWNDLRIKIVSAVISFITIFIGAYFKTFAPNELSKMHKETANKLLIVRNEITCLLTSIKLTQKSVAELEDRYREIMDKANEVYKDAPATTDKAVKLAEIALEVKKDNTFSDEKTDSFLPVELQKGGR